MQNYGKVVWKFPIWKIYCQWIFSPEMQKKILRLLADRSVDWHLSDKMIVCQNLHSSTHVSHTIVVLFSFLWTPGLTIYIINHNSHWNHSVFWGFFWSDWSVYTALSMFLPSFLFLLCSCFTVSFLIRCFNVYCFALRDFVYKKDHLN